VNVDVALSREFPVRERMRFELRFEAFNLFNHPNFSNPDNFLSDSTFGQIKAMPAHVFFSLRPGFNSNANWNPAMSQSETRHGEKVRRRARIYLNLAYRACLGRQSANMQLAFDPTNCVLGGAKHVNDSQGNSSKGREYRSLCS